MRFMKFFGCFIVFLLIPCSFAYDWNSVYGNGTKEKKLVSAEELAQRVQSISLDASKPYVSLLSDDEEVSTLDLLVYMDRHDQDIAKAFSPTIFPIVENYLFRIVDDKFLSNIGSTLRDGPPRRLTKFYSSWMKMQKKVFGDTCDLIDIDPSKYGDINLDSTIILGDGTEMTVGQFIRAIKDSKLVTTGYLTTEGKIISFDDMFNFLDVNKFSIIEPSDARAISDRFPELFPNWSEHIDKLRNGGFGILIEKSILDSKKASHPELVGILDEKRTNLDVLDRGYFDTMMSNDLDLVGLTPGREVLPGDVVELPKFSVGSIVGEGIAAIIVTVVFLVFICLNLKW